MAFVAKVRDRFGADAVVSNTVDAHYNLARFFIEGIKRADNDDKEAITEAMVDQSLMSGNGEVYLRPEDRHVDLNVLIAETTDGRLVLKKDIGRVEAPTQCQS
jgi:branched-chain amino acid transport system substrate-binding protein/urea transport system substrate-binding protein